jgi:hypothetical protein
VLRPLPGTLTLGEIGQELEVPESTLKSHTRAIYRKLGVTSRPDAIQRGQDLGILLSGTAESVASDHTAGRRAPRSLRGH